MAFGKSITEKLYSKSAEMAFSTSLAPNADRKYLVTPEGGGLQAHGNQKWVFKLTAA